MIGVVDPHDEKIRIFLPQTMLYHRLRQRRTAPDQHQIEWLDRKACNRLVIVRNRLYSVTCGLEKRYAEVPERAIMTNNENSFHVLHLIFRSRS